MNSEVHDHNGENFNSTLAALSLEQRANMICKLQTIIERNKLVLICQMSSYLHASWAYMRLPCCPCMKSPLITAVLGVGFSYCHRPLLICSGDSLGDTREVVQDETAETKLGLMSEKA